MSQMRPMGTGNTYWKLTACDYRAELPSFQQGSEHQELSDALWPRSNLLSGGGLFQPDVAVVAPVWFEYPSHESEGARSCYVIEGYTQDADGNPLDGCTVRAFTTADGLIDEECNSNSAGFYRMGVYRAGAHFLIANKGGAPDLAGASNDDVMPA
jgi:hypothetical protein